MDAQRRGTDVFTVKGLQALKPEATRYDYWCWSLPGFGIRVSPQGRKTFQFVYRFDGRPRRKTVGTLGPVSLKAALAQYHDDSAKVKRAQEARAKGETPSTDLDPGAAKVTQVKAHRAAPTVAAAAEAYLVEVATRLRPATVAEYARVIRGYLLPTLGRQKPKSIRKRDLIAILDAVAAGEFRRGKVKGKASRTMAEAGKRVFSAFFGWMAKRDLIDAVPTVFMPSYQPPVRRERFLTADERRKFFAAVDAMVAGDEIKGAIKIALLTGQRIGAISKMRWSQIDGEWWTNPSDAEKNALPNRVYLTATARAILAAMPRKDGVDAVFLGASNDGPISKQACGKAIARNVDVFRSHGVAPFSPHALRHTVRTGLSELRFPQPVKEAVLNHKNATVGGRYDHHAFSDEKREALTAWEAYLLAPSSPDAAGGKVIDINRRRAKGT